VREWAARATKKEYALVFPDYFYGQINEARHVPGSFALPERVVWDLPEATCDEIARNGFDKIVIINGHGGNPEPSSDSTYRRQLSAIHRSDAAGDRHAGPNHYAGEGSKATKAEGQLITEHTIGQLVEALKAIKADTKTLQLQKEYFDKVPVNH
jgi:creatinine amidohydrolase